MSNPVFFVDGYMEKKIVQALCPGRPIRRTDLNGKSVSLKAIAKKIAPLIRALGGKYYPIVILIDKEARKTNFKEIAEEIRTELIKEGIVNQDIRIGVADKMIENWILADWEAIANGKKKPDTTEGINGASILKNVRGSYDKTTDGVELFTSAKPRTLYSNSPSYKHFIDQLDGVKCDYLEFER